MRILALEGDIAAAVVAEREPGRGGGVGEAGAWLAAPVHRRPLGVAADGILKRLGDARGGQRELVAVVEDGRSAQGKQGHEGAARARIVEAPARRVADDVVVPERPQGPRALR
jgi:hypothetical protein